MRKGTKFKPVKLEISCTVILVAPHKKVCTNSLTKGGEIALLMASFFEGKIARVAVMNTAFNLGLVPAVYKGQTVVPGNLFYLIN